MCCIDQLKPPADSGRSVFLQAGATEQIVAAAQTCTGGRETPTVVPQTFGLEHPPGRADIYLQSCHAGGLRPSARNAVAASSNAKNKYPYWERAGIDAAGPGGGGGGEPDDVNVAVAPSPELA